MPKHAGTVAYLLLVILGWLFPEHAFSQSFSKADPQYPPQTNFSLSKKGLEFVENKGQLADQYGKPMPEVLYSSDYNGIKLYLTSTSLHYVFSRVYTSHADKENTSINPAALPVVDSTVLYRLDMHFIGANPHPRISQGKKANHYYNYYHPQCPDGLTYVPAYRQLYYYDLYPGIDMLIDATEKGMKYDFIVHPGSDPSQIRMKYDGHNSLAVKNNILSVTTPFGSIHEDELHSFMHDGKYSVPVHSHFAISGDEVRFRVGHYDKTKSLYIDPTRMWATYFGGGSYDNFLMLANSPDLTITAAGQTGSNSGIATTGAFQTTLVGSGANMIAHFDQSGNLLWATYYGGGGNSENPEGLATDTQNNIIFLGVTTSATGIATAGSYQPNNAGNSDAYIVKFNSSGVRQWGTYFGGSGSESLSNSFHKLAIDSSQNIIIGGATVSITGISTVGAYQTTYGGGTSDAFIAKFTAQGNLLWATYFGGTGNDQGSCISVDRSGNIIFSGNTTSNTNIATTGAFLTTLQGGNDVFIAKFDANCNLIWSTYYGGSSDEYPYDITVDTENAIIIDGGAKSNSGIATVGAYQTNLNAVSGNGFITKFNSSGSQVWGTYYGAIDLEGISCSSFNEIYVSGFAGMSSTNITTANAYQAVYGGGAHDVVMAKFSSSGTLLWGSYYGGTGDDNGDAVIVDAANNIYFSGATSSILNIATTGAHQTVYGGNPFDGFLLKFCDVTIPILTAVHDTLCSGTLDTIYLNNTYTTIKWYDSSAHLTSLDNATKYVIPSDLMGLHPISVEVTNVNSCDGTSDTLWLLVHQSPVTSAGKDTAICAGSTVQLQGKVTSGGTAPFTYFWSPAAGLSGTSVSNPKASPVMTTTYHLTITDANGCTGTDSIKITINPNPQISPKNNFIVCSGTSVTIGDSARGGTPPYTYLWFPANGLSAVNKPIVKATPSVTTTYTELVTDKNGCQTQALVTVGILPLPVPNISPAGFITLCGNDSVTLHADKGFITYQWSDSSKADSLVVRAAGTYSLAVSDFNGCIGMDSVKVVSAPLPAPMISGPGAACPNSTVDYSVIYNTGDSYQWSLSGGGAITSGVGSNAIKINWTTQGNWTVSITERNSSGCSKDTSLTVVVNSTLVPIISPSGSITICNGDTVILHTSKGYVSYKWSNGATADSTIITQSGNYSVTVTAAGGCQGTSGSVQVTVLPGAKPQPVISASATTLCAGDTAILSLTQSFASYKWSTGEKTPSIDVTKAGKYFVTVTNSDGCEGISKQISITVLPRPVVVITASSATTFCDNDSIILSATVGLASYKWNTGDSTESIIIHKSGSYSVTATGADGCSAASLPVTIQVNATPKPVITGAASVCPNGTASYNAENISGDTYLWSLVPASSGTITSPNTPATNIQWGATGSAILTLVETSASGCSSMVQLPVTISSTLVPVITANGSLSICEGDSVVLDAGSGYQSYRWSDNGIQSGASSEKLVVSFSGSYSVFVTSGAGCSGSSMPVVATVSPLPQPVITTSGPDLTTQVFSLYQWNLNGSPISGATGQIFTPSSKGTYTVTVTDVNGCSNTSAPFGYGLNATATIAIAPMTTANPGDNVSIPVSILNANDIVQSGAKNYVGIIRFNNSMLISRGATPIGSVNGKGRIITINGNNTVSSGILQTLDFIAALGTDSCTDITLDTFYWTDASVTVLRENGEFCLTGICSADGHLRLVDPSGVIKLSNSHPNPAANIVEFDFEISEKGTTRLFLADLLGKPAMTVLNEELKPGAYTITADVSKLASGNYLYALQTPSLIVTKIMQITH